MKLFFIIIEVKIILTFNIMENEVKKEIKNILEMIYWLYQKDLKSGNIVKDKNIKTFGKICKKRNPLKNNDDSALFSYGN